MRIKEILQESIGLHQLLLQDISLQKRISDAADAMVTSLGQGGKIHFCGNGGSAADAQHLAAELSGRFYFDRPSLNAEALHCNTSYLTAVANDYSFDKVYGRLLEGTGKEGDVLVGISTSGNSANILNAFAVAKQKGIFVIAMTGETGGKMKDYANILLNFPSKDTPRIQELHILAGHIICEMVEEKIFGKEI